MAVKDIINSNTAGIVEATELLSGLSDRNGEFVWKKYSVTETTVSNPTVHLKQNGLNVDVTSISVDVSTVDDKFFDGFHLTVGTQYCFKYENEQLQYSNGTSWYPCSYDSAKHQIVFTSSGLDFNHDAIYDGTKTILAKDESTIEFVTSDDENSYPNSGIQDGVYYVKLDPSIVIAENIREGINIFDIIGTMGEGVNLSALRFTKAEAGVFTPSARNTQVTIQHGLGVAPKFAYIGLRGSTYGVHVTNYLWCDTMYPSQLYHYCSAAGSTVLSGHGGDYFEDTSIRAISSATSFTANLKGQINFDTQLYEYLFLA